MGYDKIREYLFEKYATAPGEFTLAWAQALLDAAIDEIMYDEAVIGMRRVSDMLDERLWYMIYHKEEFAALAAGIEGQERPFFSQEDEHVYCAFHVGKILRGIVGWEDVPAYEPDEYEEQDGEWWDPVTA